MQILNKLSFLCRRFAAWRYTRRSWRRERQEIARRCRRLELELELEHINLDREYEIERRGLRQTCFDRSPVNPLTRRPGMIERFGQDPFPGGPR